MLDVTVLDDLLAASGPSAVDTVGDVVVAV
jgi:hypothetical protein